MIDWRGRRHCLQNPSRIESWGAAAASLRSSGRTNASVPTHSWGFHSYGIHTFLCHPHFVWHRIPPASPQIGIFRATDHWPLATGVSGDFRNRGGGLRIAGGWEWLLESREQYSAPKLLMPEITRRLDRAELGKRIERAEKLLQKGKAAEALEEYLLSLRDDPENDTVRQLAADLCLSQNRTHDAVRLLGELFERQVKAEDATRASLTYKKLARHGSPTWEQKFRFGQLLEGSNKKLAVGTYESALSDLAKLENKQGALEVLGRVVALEPIQANFLRVAELSSEVGDSRAAAAAFKRVAKRHRGMSAPIRKIPRMKKSRWPTARACWGRGRWGLRFLFLRRR